MTSTSSTIKREEDTHMCAISSNATTAALASTGAGTGLARTLRLEDILKLTDKANCDCVFWMLAKMTNHVAPPASHPPLLGAIKDNVIYDACNPSWPRFLRVEEPRHPFEDFSLWVELVEVGKKEDPAGYAAFSKGTEQDKARDLEYEETNQRPPKALLRVPESCCLWCLTG